MKYCPHCGQLIKSDALVCPYCGAPQSRVARDEPQKARQSQPDDFNQENPDQNSSDWNTPDDRVNRDSGQIKYSRARLTPLDMTVLGLSVFNAATLFFLGGQGLIRPYYINNIGTFVTVILSLFSIILLCFEMHQNRKNRLPNLAAIIALIGSVSVFVLIFAFNQRVLLISMVILVISLFLFDRELKKTY